MPSQVELPHHLTGHRKIRALSQFLCFFFFAIILDMLERSPNEAKRFARLKYKDEVLQLHQSGKSIREITRIVNKKLAFTNLRIKRKDGSIEKVTLSKSTIADMIKKYSGAKDA